MPHDLPHPGFTIALALLVGIIAQLLARPTRVPAIVLLLGAGALLGRDGAGFIRTDELGPALRHIVSFSVAVILFEGALHLNVRALRREARVVQLLVVLGGTLTAAGAATLAHLLLGWDWSLALVFGSVVSVTGPTVITPLLRRFRIKRNLETILEAEGIFLDGVGAVAAVVVFEVALTSAHDAASSVGVGAGTIVLRIAAGAAAGAVAGAIILLARKVDRFPRDLENVFTLAFAFFVFEGANRLVPESGLPAVIVAGAIVGNFRRRELGPMVAFKGQLTTLLLSLVFVLLAADVHLATVLALGLPGVAVVVGVMLLVRPMGVWICTIRSGLGFRDKAYLSWLAPRGIVAVAVASLFAQELSRRGVADAAMLRALVFLVVMITVTLQGMGAGVVARLLGVQAPPPSGFVILGANALSRKLAKELRSHGESAVLIDANPDRVRAAEEEGHEVVFGNGFLERTLERARAGRSRGCIGATANSEVNFLFLRAVRDYLSDLPVLVAVGSNATGATETLAAQAQACSLFGAPRQLDAWVRRMTEGARIERWKLRDGNVDKDGFASMPEHAVLPLV
ncbi:MAG: cation:proton antiporter, partial [Myxococcota bacterium]